MTVFDIERRTEARALTLPDKGTGLPGRLMGRGEQKRTPNLAFDLRVSPGGTRLFVTHVMADTGVTRAGVVATGGYGVGAANPLVATISTFDLETGKLTRTRPDFSRNDTSDFSFISFGDNEAQKMSQPVALALDPRRARVFMAAMGSDRIMAFDTRSSDPSSRPMSAWTVGAAPVGIAVTSDGTKAFVLNAHDHSVSTVDLEAPLGNRNQPTRWSLSSKRGEAFAKSPLPESAQRGRRAFTFALDAAIGGRNRFACASCHPDGRDDGLVWHIGAGLRATPILADRVEGTGPFNWLGTEAHLEDNIRQTVKRLGGTGCTDQQADDLALFITRYLPSLDNPHPKLDARVALGRRLFHSEEVGCSGCHDSSNRFTDGGRHDVGTTTKLEFDLWKRFGKAQKAKKPGGPPARSPPLVAAMPPPTEPIPEAPVRYDTPSLRHLWASAPYLHDGSVRTLEDLVSHGNPNDRMGRTSQLSESQRKALVAYLRSL